MPNIVEIIKQAANESYEATKPMNLLIGVVTSESPLVITLEQRLPLSEEFLILTKHVTDHYVDMTVNHNTKEKSISGLSHSHKYSGTTEITSIDQHTHNIPSDNGSTISGEATENTTKHSHGYEGVTEVAFNEGTEETTKHSHEYKGIKRILLHYGLKQGESVLMLRMQGGQKYLVLDRIGDVPVKGEWIQ